MKTYSSASKAAAAICVLLAAGTGFSLGWYPDRQTRSDSSKTSPAPPHAPATAEPTRTKSDLLPGSMGTLASADDCRQFLKELDTRYAGRHPLLISTARDFALRRWLELDAESALTEAERQSGNASSKSLEFGNDLFRVWLDLNPESAIAAWN